jgi:hypothetical protein
MYVVVVVAAAAAAETHSPACFIEITENNA